MANVSTFRLKELIAAPFTPLNQDGEINYSLLAQYADYMVNTNFTGIFINGSLAEGLSMTLDERKRLAEAWMKASDGRLQVVVHVGTNCIKDAQELARHAEEIKVDAIAAFSPSYYKPENEEVLLEVMSQISSAAPNTPFYYYDINFCTGLYINARKFMEMAKKKIPTLRGLKNSSRELPDAHAVTKVEDCQVLIGTDVQYLSCLALEMPGVVVASYLGNVFSDMRKAFDSGDVTTARKLQNTAEAVNSIRAKYGGGINVAKYIFKILTGMDVGPVRLPLRQMSLDQFENMKKDFNSADLVNISQPREQ
ncbi:N-acetylneuraminate lyase-like [Ruditapes philippinarum]|uniref:N-acetylneuraminate lyase-like n=1 Tax=Ruditapes philippinarum TaxID=129788 RepID=UPI00295A9764|nr:N-acetylneuraminate lyase-like [Ruditapes philippinarum]